MTAPILNSMLLIDDDEINNFICKKELAGLGLSKKVSVCLSAEQALDYLKTCKTSPAAPFALGFPELIFLDINMPYADGFDFLNCYMAKEYHLQFPRTKVVILSSSVYKKDIEKAKSYPVVQEFITKPLVALAVEKVIKEYHTSIKLEVPESVPIRQNLAS